MKPVRVYRLEVTYPAGSHPSQPDYDPTWTPHGEAPDDVMHRDLDGHLVVRTDWFRWPAERLFLSRSGAEHRAKVFRQYGAVVRVVSSRPVAW